MGVASSKPVPDSRSITPSSMRKSSKSPKLSKNEQLQKKLEVVQNVQTEIELFAGDRHSSRYSQIQETLTSISQDFQDVKNSTTKEKTRSKCDQALNDIQKCLQRLESRVNANERQLDGAAVESHSFINHSFNSPTQSTPPASSKRTVSPPLLQQHDYEHSQVLDRLEHETHKLEQDLKLSIQLDDTNQLTFLERKIQLLYTDLEMVVIKNNSSLSDIKATIGKRLIKCNNQIKKYRRISIHGKQNALSRIEHKLEYLEIQALTYEGVKNDREFKEIKQNLENYLNDVSQIDDTEKTKEIANKIKNTLKELVNRAEENQNQFEASEKLKQMEETIRILKEKVDQHKGSTSDPSYIQLDQGLRNIWANIAEVRDVNEHIRRHKEKSITEVQSVLKTLHENAKSTENQHLTKIQDFQKFWNQINYELDVQKVQSSASKPIIEILKKISNEINTKTNALEKIERRKSTGNLVVTKIIHLEDVSKSQTSLVDAPIKTEIKVQPTLTVISEVQRIESEIKAMCQEIKNSSFTKISNHYERFHQKLEQFNNALMKIESNRNGTIDSNKKRAIKVLREAYQILEEMKNKSDRSSKVFEVMDVHTEIQYYRQQIKTFKGVTKDQSYDKIKQGLSNCLTKLQVIDEEHAIKQDVIRQIQQYHQELETKLAENQAKVKVNEKSVEVRRQVSQETKSVIEQLQKLKSQVERFSGVHDGLQFKQLQDELNNCNKRLENINSMGDERLESTKVQTKQKIRKYLKILEEKSTKNEMVSENRKSQIFNAPHRRINEIRDQLVEIKAQTEEFGGRYKDKDYVAVERELLKCMDELKLVDDQGHKSVVISKEQYEDYIVKLLAYFEEKAKLNASESTPTNEEAFKIADPTKLLALIKNKIEKLKLKIELSNDDFTELMKEETSLRRELDEIQVGNVTPVRETKKQLTESLKECAAILEENVAVLKKINSIKERVNQISSAVRKFNGTKNDETYSNLDETLIKAMLELDSITFSKSAILSNAKGDVRKMIEKAMKTLSDRVKMVPVLI